MAGYLLCIDLILAWVTFGHLNGPGFGMISPAIRIKMKRRKSGRADRINIDDLMMKCRQKVVGGLKVQKLTTSWH